MSSIQWHDFKGFVCEYLGLEDHEVYEDTNIYNELGIDSLGIVSLGMKLQRQYQATVPLSAVSGITTLGGMLDILNDYSNNK